MVSELHEMVSEFSEEDEPIAVGIEVDRGLLVGALVGVGYDVYAVNPLAASRYRERHGVSGAKSDPDDAKVLADLVRTDRHNHRPSAATASSSMPSGCWSDPISVRSGAASARSTPCARRCASSIPAPSRPSGPTWRFDALAVFAIAPTPSSAGRCLVRRSPSALRRGGRQRGVEARAEAIQAILRDEYLAAGPVLSGAYGIITKSSVEVIAALSRRDRGPRRGAGRAF